MPLLAGPVFVAQNTTTTNDMASDGYGWASARPLLVDPFGKIILLSQRYNSTTVRHTFTVSNDGGATWTEPARTGFFDADGEGFTERGTVAYDPVHDQLHVLWNFLSTSDGIVYRRYTLTRDGSNNITGITRVAGINLQLDLQTDGSMAYVHPWILWVPDGGAHGSVLCGWGARNASGVGNKNELRVSMRKLSNTAADNTAGNWIAPVTAATTAIGNAPSVAYSVVAVNNFGAAIHSAAHRKAANTHVNDVFIAWWDGDVSGTSPLWRYSRLDWDAVNADWSNAIIGPTTITAMKLAGSDGGYSLKYQLQTQWAEDTVNDRMYIGFPLWKDNTDGDTFSFTYVDAAGAIGPLTHVVVCGGAHSYAPTGDLIHDAIANALVVAYLKTGDEFAYVQAFDADGVVVQDETLMFDDDIVDIPLLWHERYDGKLLSAFRGNANGVPPYLGYAGTMAWASAPAAPDTTDPISIGPSAGSRSGVITIGPRRPR